MSCHFFDNICNNCGLGKGEAIDWLARNDVFLHIAIKIFEYLHLQPNNFFDQCANMLWSTKSLKKPSSIDFVLICIGKGVECGTSSSILWGVIVARDTSSSLMFFQISCPSPCSICFTRHKKGLRHRLIFCPLGKSPLPPFVTQFMHLLFWVLSLGWTFDPCRSFLSPSSMLAFSFTKFGRVSSFRGLTWESEGTKMGTTGSPKEIPSYLHWA